MKNITCPISGNRISEAQPRVSAFIVILLLGVSMLLNSFVIPLLLVFDFFQRGFVGRRYSVVGQIAYYLASKWFSNAPQIDRAPKVFAARLGFIFTGLIFVLYIIGASGLANAFSLLLMVFAGLECFFNFCVGCYIYTFLNYLLLKRA
ncbi:DUF4395 domain-containing protein [Carboxylicivirga sp. N1Y90]|uniref:DUF4395 domain-containing protein n=1 Tax=Carboxylicivirga fragile TaxID=3417571 RepID=UPI003D356A33|nr:DUF4395 domain-containing protein [Marinilabiliaceae bacterium N1Y90]